MGKFVKGDVVTVPFPFSDLTGERVRPAFVVASLLGDDVILCMITTQKRRDSYSIPLTAGDFSSGGLPCDSYVRPNRLFTADSNIISSRKGTLTETKIKEIIGKIIELIGK